MLIYKLMGGMMLLLASWGLGNVLCRRERTRLTRLGGYCALIRYMTSQIEMYGSTVAELLHKCDAKVLSDCGFDVPPDDFFTLIAAAGDSIDEGSVHRLEAIGQQLRNGCRESLLDACRGASSALDAAWQSARTHCDDRCRVIRVLCLCAGIGAAVILF